MTWVNPQTPNLADYASFLASVAGIPPSVTPGVLPSAEGAVTAATTTTITDSAQIWTANQWAGCTVYDSTLSMSAVIISSTTDQITFAALPAAPGIGDAYLIVQPIVASSLSVALRTVNSALNDADPYTYTLAVYNLATDRLINFAPDQPNQTFFKTLRVTFRITDASVGAVSSASDQGTSSAVVNPDWMHRMTLRDLQTLKTDYGRNYMAMAMDYGPNIWALV